MKSAYVESSDFIRRHPRGVCVCVWRDHVNPTIVVPVPSSLHVLRHTDRMPATIAFGARSVHGCKSGDNVALSHVFYTHSDCLGPCPLSGVTTWHDVNSSRIPGLLASSALSLCFSTA